MSEQADDDQPQASTPSGARKGGKARAEKLTPAQRSEIARKGAAARWNSEDSPLPVEEYPGVLVVGNLDLPCAVLSTRERVLSERGVTAALGGKRGGSHWKRLQNLGDDEYLPVFISAENLRPFMSPSLRVALSRPIVYRRKGGGTANGVLATMLPEICDVFLKARRAGKLSESQLRLADTAEILQSGLAQVGIIALVDEATGYQAVRELNELHKILERYVAKELLPWSLRFPPEFYKELFRLRGWEWDAMSAKRPKRVGMDTAEIVYERLPSGVLDELRRNNPADEAGRRRRTHHVNLTPDIGVPALEKQVAIATALMRASKTWQGFRKLLDKAVPVPNGTVIATQEELELGEDEEWEG